MKESYDDIINIRRRIFKEVARSAYEDLDVSDFEDAAYRLVPGEVPKYRDDIFRARAVTEERLRLALGMDVRKISEFKKITDGFEEIDFDHNVYTQPLINIIKFACEACPTKRFYVTDNCRKCMAKPCKNVCPVGAVTIGKNRAVIDHDKCIKCGRCEKTCPFNAIIQFDRPCASICGVDAIGSDKYGRAEIDQDKCVQCGRCVTQCPFGAIADKTQIYQLIKAIKDPKKDIYAIVAPSFVGQFGANASPEQIFEAIRKLGFKDVIEVGLGADLTTLHEAQEYLERVPGEIPFMATSCCYSWSLLVKKQFPDIYEYISESSSPMIYTAQHIHNIDKDAIVCFIGPCTSKKSEAIDTKVKDFVEFVITFEELMGMFEAKNIDPAHMIIDKKIEDSSRLGRGYAIAGGVAEAVKEIAKELSPDRDIKIERADTLTECSKLMKLAKAGKYNGYLLEGMACPGGCIAGMGTINSTTKVKKLINKFKSESEFDTPLDNNLIENE